MAKKSYLIKNVKCSLKIEPLETLSPDTKQRGCTPGSHWEGREHQITWHNKQLVVPYYVCYEKLIKIQCRLFNNQTTISGNVHSVSISLVLFRNNVMAKLANIRPLLKDTSLPRYLDTTMGYLQDFTVSLMITNVWLIMSTGLLISLELSTKWHLKKKLYLYQDTKISHP